VEKQKNKSTHSLASWPRNLPLESTTSSESLFNHYYLTMFDYVCVFSTGGVLLWQNQIYADFKMEFINLFIKTCLLEQNYNAQLKKYSC